MFQAYSNYNSYAKTFNGNFKYSIDINIVLYIIALLLCRLNISLIVNYHEQSDV